MYVGADALAGDVDADDTPDLAVGSGPGMPGRVRGYSGKTGEVIRDTQPFDTGMTGGVRVGLAYVDDGGYADVIAGTGVTATVCVYSGSSGDVLAPPLGEYQPFGSGSTGGVYVAASNDPPPISTDPVTLTGGSGQADVSMSVTETAGGTAGSTPSPTPSSSTRRSRGCARATWGTSRSACRPRCWAR